VTRLNLFRPFALQSDMSIITEKMLRQQLSEHFQHDMLSRKVLIKAEASLQPSLTSHGQVSAQCRRCTRADAGFRKQSLSCAAAGEQVCAGAR
jgi:hypothetical protein